MPLRALSLLLFFPLAVHAAEAIPRPEHPRPDRVRGHWLNLNGPWEFRFDAADSGRASGWSEPGAAGFDRRITVPFGWQSPLSGIRETGRDAKVGWYRRNLRVPDTFPAGERVWLRFEAVDWEAQVWVNGKAVASHEGGYTPFEADITDAVRRDGDNTIVVRAADSTDPGLPTGKQVGWYTPTSGIWQTAWLESRPGAHLADFTLRTLALEPARVAVTVEAAGLPAGPFAVAVRSADPTVAPLELKGEAKADGTGTAVGELAIAAAKPWSPETPHLYDLTLELTSGGATDAVRTYLGLRTIARGTLPGEAFERVFLNGKPIYLRGALDQSFNPEGVYTAPSDAFLKEDIALAKRLGLNFLRIHIKPDEPRRLYWADRLGLLIMEDMPNTWRQDARARAAWEATMRGVVRRDRNHPSIFSWVAFNETWGLGTPDAYKADGDTQAWVGRMVDALRGLDASRLVEDNSPCNYDHITNTDFNSWHFYIDDHGAARRHIEEVVARSAPGSAFNMVPGQAMGPAPLINSEYGSVSAGGGDRDVSWGFRDLTTQLRRHPKIQGYVYTELADIEWEHNGFVDYDRGPKAFGYDAWIPGMTVADLQGADFVGYDAPPAIVGKPGEAVRVPVFVSHYSDRAAPPRLWWWVDGHDGEGRPVRIARPQSRPVTWTAYGVTGQGEVEVTLPDGPFVGALALALVEGDAEPFGFSTYQGAAGSPFFAVMAQQPSNWAVNRPIAMNFVNLVARPEAPAPRVERRDDRTAVVRFAPEEFSRAKFSGGSDSLPGKAYGRGHGTLTYRLQLPKAVAEAGPERITLRVEAAAKGGRDQVDWPERVNRQDYPQTDRRTVPTAFLMGVNGHTPEGLTELPDDPADARGVLSHENRNEHGSYGYTTEVTIDVPEAVRAELAAGKPLVLELTVPEGGNGLALYGAGAGAYPFDPTLTLRTARPLPADLGADATRSLAVDLAATRRVPLLHAGDSTRGRPASWSYTTTDPGPGWERPGFDATGWRGGTGGFGTPGTPALRANTAWDTPTIWLRTEVDLPALGADDRLTLHLFHDEDVTVFVNGQRLLRQRGFATAYEDLKLTPALVGLFRTGRNVIAVQCRQTGGGQGVDLGLTLERAEP
jgi:hypothetical protein